MVKEVKVFEAADGTLHKLKRDALKSDLIRLLKTNSSINEPIAKAMADMVVQNKELRDLVELLGKELKTNPLPTPVAKIVDTSLKDAA